MAALAKLDLRRTGHEIPADLPGAGLYALGRIRLAALKCRSSARLDLFRACEMLGSDRALATETALDALIRTVGQALGRSPRFFRPGGSAASFDERWLLALMAALRAGDEASATFLLHSRVPRHARRSVAYLCRRVALGLADEDRDTDRSIDMEKEAKKQ